MSLFLDILLRVTLPIVALIVVGGVLQPRLKLDVASLNRVQVYVVMPCFLMHHLSTAAQPIAAVLPTVMFSVVQFALLLAAGWGAAVVFRLDPAYRPILALGTVYANLGFFGIALVQLAFPAEFILQQSVVTSLITIMIVTVGVWLLAPPDSGRGGTGRLRQAFETPVIPAVAVGLTLRALEIKLPVAMGLPVQMLGSIFTPLALYTLGAQLAESERGTVERGPLALLLAMKLLVAPALTWVLARGMGVSPGLTALYVAGAATPVGVLLGVYCAEFGRNSRLVASAILVSTLLSPLVVSAWILLGRLQ